MDECIIERGEDMCNTEYELTLSDLWSKTHWFFLLDDFLLWRL